MRSKLRVSRHFLFALVAFTAAACSPRVQEPPVQLIPAPPATPAQTNLFAAEQEWAFPAGSVVPSTSRDGMVTSTDRVASEIGAEILRRGGNAVDAAIATHFALAVVNPEAGNIGGGGFLVARIGGESFALDFREKAPGAATRDMYLNERGEATDRSRSGHLASGVPGSVAGMWAAHQRFGTLPWAELVAPAIALADGIVMHERLAQSLSDYEQRLSRDAGTAATFLIDGRAPRVGERFAQPDLAATLRRVAAEGKRGFYEGRTAELIEAEMRSGGGIITRADLAAYEAVWRDPVELGYRGHTVVSMPPPSSGGPTLGELLNILEGYDLAGLGYHSAEHVHLFTEAAKLAYADRNSYLADPDFVEQPIQRMISDEYAAERRSAIRSSAATPSAEVEPGLGPVPGIALAGASESTSTTHFSVVDRSGNAVAITTTLNSLYGNAITVDGAGILLNNEMDDFTVLPGAANMFGLVQGEANAIEPGKRMLSSMTPTIVLDPSGRVKLVTGSPGGSTIITTVAQIVSNVVDFGMNLGNATAAPRLHHQHLPDELLYEVDGLLPPVVARLRAMGHQVEERSGYSGDVTSILVEADGTIHGTADPRRGGGAVGVNRSLDVVQ